MIHLAEIFTRKNSGEIARKRLKLLLVSDRSGFSPEILEMIRNDFLHAVSRYMEVDGSQVTVCVVRSSNAAAEGEEIFHPGKLPALYAGVPIQSISKTQEAASAPVRG